MIKLNMTVINMPVSTCSVRTARDRMQTYCLAKSGVYENTPMTTRSRVRDWTTAGTKTYTRFKAISRTRFNV